MKILILAAALALTGCATTSGADFRPLVDRPSAMFEQNLAECQAYAHSTASTGSTAAAGAIVGALLGVGLLALSGGRGGFGNEMAAFGAVTGGLGAASAAHESKESVIRNCLRGRGESVLN